MNTVSDSAAESEKIISVDAAGPIYLCVVCRERIAIPCLYHCTACEPS